MEKKEFKVGDIIHPLGKDVTLKVVEGRNCDGCYYENDHKFNICCNRPCACSAVFRKDGVNIIFKQIDKGLMSEETAQKLKSSFNKIKNDMETDLKGKQVKRLNIIPPEGYEMNVGKHGIVTFIKNKEKEPGIIS